MKGNPFWLTDAQMMRLQPFFPKRHGKPRVDGRRVLSGRSEDGEDRRDLSQSASRGNQPAVGRGRAGDQRDRLIGRAKGGMNTKRHAVTDSDGRPIRFFMTAGQISDYTGAVSLLCNLPKAEGRLADLGYDAEWFREALKDRGIRPCIPGGTSRGKPLKPAPQDRPSRPQRIPRA